MANAAVIVLTQPGSTGLQTYNLPANFDPKAVMLFGTPQTADGSIASYSYCIGFGTYRGSVVQQRYMVIRGLDAAASADTARHNGSNALFSLMTQSAGAATIDLEIDLVSMQGGATSQVVLDWVNLHTTASIRIFMVVLGGSDIDALVGDFTPTSGVTFDNVTVTSGFGQPDLVLFAGGMSTTGAFDAVLTFGFAKKGEPGRGWSFAQTDGNTASITSVRQSEDNCICRITATADVFLGQLDTVIANWPIDGFRTLYNAAVPSGQGGTQKFLAIKTTAQIATGVGDAPTSGTPPVIQDYNVGFTPKLGLVLHWNLLASGSRQDAIADQCGLGIGAYDGTQEAWAGFTEDDAATTMDANNQQSTNKIIRNYNQAAALQSEADGAFSGNIFRFSWNDIDTSPRQYQWLVIGNAAPAAVGPPKPPVSRRLRHLLPR